MEKKRVRRSREKGMTLGARRGASGVKRKKSEKLGQKSTKHRKKVGVCYSWLRKGKKG